MITKTGVDIIASAQLILDKVEKMKILAANVQNPFAGNLKNRSLSLFELLDKNRLSITEPHN